MTRKGSKRLCEHGRFRKIPNLLPENPENHPARRAT
jgi:hypothetical protein